MPQGGFGTTPFGTTPFAAEIATSNLTMVELIDIAYHKINITVNAVLQTRAQTLLNLIIREADGEQ